MNNILYCGLITQRTTQGGEFGALRSGGITHRGRDSVARAGTPVYGSGTGKVIKVTVNDPVYQRSVTVEYATPGGKVMVMDGHLQRVLLGVGDDVILQTHIADSGGLVNADHLHEGTWVNGTLTNPDLVLAARSLIAAGTTGTPIETRNPTMFVVTDTSPTSFLVTDLGMWVLDTTAKITSAKKVCENNSPLQSDLIFVATLLASTPWRAYGPVSGGAGGLTAAQDAKLTAIPSSDAATVDEAELGQAETSGAQLVIDALTPQITAVKNAVLGIGISHS